MTVLLNSVPFIAILTIFLWAAIRYWRLAFFRQNHYPPGPPVTSWITGNASDLATGKIWETYTRWAATYGKIFSLRIISDRMIIINSLDVAYELFEKRSHIYSSRPYVAMIDMMDWDYSSAFKPYGAEWRTHRRLLQQTFKPDAARDFRPIQTKKVGDMLLGLLTSPQDFKDHVKTVSAAIIMSIMYGHDIAPKDDYFVTLSEAGVIGLSKSAFPSAALVNTLPFLRFLPSWFPGAGFKRYALSVKGLVAQMLEVPYDHVINAVAAGTAPPSWVADRLDECKSESEHRLMREVAASAYVAGADTTVSVIMTFFVAMTANPDIQRKAQKEIDSVVGSGRCVDYEDQDSLPYVNAILRETFRWRPVLPLGVARATTEEDVYEGYYIPKGAMIFPNTWAMTRDPLRYPDPEIFNPDRFFDKDGKLNDDDMSYTFGFGRRGAWLAVTTILSLFDIEKKKDASGKELPFQVEYNRDLISHPHPFECAITPRSESARRIIMDMNAKA